MATHGYLSWEWVVKNLDYHTFHIFFLFIRHSGHHHYHLVNLKDLIISLIEDSANKDKISYWKVQMS